MPNIKTHRPLRKAARPSRAVKSVRVRPYREALSLMEAFNRASRAQLRTQRWNCKAPRDYAKLALAIARGVNKRMERNGGLLAERDLATIAVLQCCHHEHGQDRSEANELHQLSVRNPLTALLQGAGIEMNLVQKKKGFLTRLERARGKH